jgi:hypothetical protein
MEHDLARYVKYYPMDAQKSQEIVNSQGKLITIEEIFLDIGKQMLETSYILNLGQ